MADVNVPYLEPGLAAFEQLDTYLAKYLLMGDTPKLASFPMAMPAETTFSQFHVVGRNAQGLIVAATWNATPANIVQPIGVVTQAVATGVGETGVTVPVFYMGHFNIDALVWDATWDTDAKKLASFRGAPTPTQILVSKR